jgi:hypothetical protein
MKLLHPVLSGLFAMVMALFVVPYLSLTLVKLAFLVMALLIGELRHCLSHCSKLLGIICSLEDVVNS